MKASIALVSMAHMKALIDHNPRQRFPKHCYRMDASRVAFWVAVDEDFLSELEKKHDITGTASEILTYEAESYARKNRKDTESSD